MVGKALKDKHSRRLILLFAALPLACLLFTHPALAVTETFTTSAASPWTCPAGVTSVVIECWGGGGAGGGNNGTANGAGGGGGGAYAKQSYSVSGGSTYAYSVGAAGLGSANADGGVGGDTWWVNSTTIMAKGGSGGKSNANGQTGGAGGLASASYGTTAKYDGGWGMTGRVHAVGQGGWGGSSAGTAAAGYNVGSSPAFSTMTYPTASTPTGGGHGGNGGTGAGNAPASGNGGGGGGSGEGTNVSGGNGAVGKISITYTLPFYTIYYSVGTTATALYNANASATGGVMTLASAAATNIGLGDEVRVGSSRYYIRLRETETSFRIQNSEANSGTAGDTAITFGSTTVTIYRAFNSLSAAEANASDASHLNTTDLNGYNFQLNFVCYADGVDGTVANVDGWTTSATCYIRIFTPVSASEVGTSQRHDGKWNTSRYYISAARNTIDGILRSAVNYVQIDGLQVEIQTSGSAVNGIDVSAPSGTGEIYVTNCIVKNSYAANTWNGIGLGNNASWTGTHKIWNNVVIGGTSSTGMYHDYGTAYIYNNTIYTVNYGFYTGSNGTRTLKNNIVQGATWTLYGTWNTEDYNVTNHATDLTGTNSREGKTVTFVNAGSGDLHLSASDAEAKNYGVDLSGTFTTDIDGVTRPATWDMGADEYYTPPEKDLNIYYSVGTNSSALYSGNAAVVAKGILDLASNAGNDVGVGDEVRVGSSRYYIRSRIAADSFRIENSSVGGGTPGDTNITFANTAITIYRAFNSLSAAEAGASGANYLNTANLTTNSNILHFACYGDGADNTATTVDGYTTSATSYIRIFTPTASTEVGTTQRHAGAWTTSSKYYLSVSNGTALTISDAHVKVTGLQIAVAAVNGNSQMGINITGTGGSADSIWISHCIIKGTNAGSNTNHIGLQLAASGTGVCKIWNNIIYDFGPAGTQTTDYGAYFNDADYTTYFYNNTIYNCRVGLGQNAGTVVAKNNIVTGITQTANSNTYIGTFGAGTDYNATNSTDAIGAGSNNRTGQTIGFVSASDLHLVTGDAGAKSQGTNLSADGNLPISDDIDGASRTVTWCIGADENDAAAEKDANIYYSVGTNAAALYTGDAAAVAKGLLDLASGADNGVGVGDEVRVGSNRFYIRARIAADSFRIENSTANSGTPGDTNITFASQAITIYRAFNSLSAAEANAGGANYLNTSNLTTNSNILHFACYGDGADNTAVTVDGWTTSSTSYIRIFVPKATTEVGTSQRHAGVWSTASKYYLSVSNATALTLSDEHVRIEGLQIAVAAVNGNSQMGINVTGTAGGTDDVRISNCIIKGTNAGSYTNHIGLQLAASGTGTVKAWNNIIYDFGPAGTQTTDYGAYFNDANFTTYFYNNTIYNCCVGLGQGAGTVVAKNNIVTAITQTANSNTYIGTFGAGTDYNATASTDDIGAGSNNRISQTFTFTTAGSDFHLTSSDAGARTYGTDLSADGNLSFTTDIDGLTRSGTWDIGADEATTDVAAPTNVGLSSPANGTTGAATTPTLTVLTATDAGSGLHATPYYIEVATNTAFTTGTQNSGWQAGTTWAPTLSGGTTYYWRVKAKDAVGNTSSACGFTADAAGYGSFTTQLGTGTYSTYSYFDTLYFNTTSTGANVPDAVSNFPVLVRFTNATFPFSQAQGDGDDIRFLDADGSTTLSHERERYDSTNGVAEFWVLVPSVSGNSTSDFIIRFWGNSSASTASSPENTFQTSNGFVCVLHLNESADQTGKDYIDATSNSNDGTGGNGTAADVPAQATGVIGKGQLYDGTDYIRVADHATLNVSNPMMSAWFKPAMAISAMADYAGIGWHDNYGGARGPGLGNCITGAENTISFRINGNNASNATVTVNDNGAWVYLVGKYNGSAVKAYRNAGVTASDSATTTYSTAVSYLNDPMDLGWMQGSLDEFRLESVARSAQWIQLCYASQRADQTLIRYSLKTLYYSVGTTATAMYSDNASASSGTLTLASAAVDSVGLGDEVRVGSNRYYIRSRSSSTSFGIQNSAANSGIVGDTAITFSSTAITIYRAFNSLNAAVSYDASSAGDASHANTASLALNNYQLNIVCYADGADNTAATVNGWTTSSTNYIRIYTPTATSEVGKTQRHAGVWSTSKYYLSVSNAKALTISDEDVRVEGLQIQVSGTNAAGQSCVYISGATGTCDQRISSCLIRGRNTGNTQVNHNGIWLTSSGSGTLKVWNNVIYDFAEGGQAGNIYLSDANYTSYIYNNTLYNGYGFGLWFDAGSVIAKNNIVGNSPGAPAYTYDGSFSAGTDYNATNGTDAIGAGSNNRTSQTFTFVSAGTNFHLSGADAGAKDYGTNLSADANLAFSTDIEGETRQGTWDIGADEAPPTYNMYYSVGTRTAALYSGNAYGAGGLMTISGTGSDTIGVGDEVRVGSNRYYITQRYSNTYYDIQNSAANGGAPGATAITFAEQAITIYRAFNSLRGAVDVTNGNADDASHLNTSDLVSGNFILNIACYGDGADVDTARIDGWTTGASNYIRVFTPTASNEVGLSQRHDGKWKSSGAYILDLPLAEKNALSTVEDFVRIDGLQIDASGLTGTIVRGFRSEASASGDIRVSNCIIRGSVPNCNGSGIKSENGTFRAWNNVLYNNGAGIQITTGTAYAYNNTVWGGYNGIKVDGGTMVAKNNLVYKDATTDNYVGTFDAAGTNNLSGPVTITDAQIPATNKRDGVDVTFVNAGSADFHISASDAGARNYGTDLSADANISFSTDIDGNTRTGTWDIGADESYTAPKVIYYSVGTTATALYDGTGSASSGTLTITTSSASNTIGLGDEVRQGANEYYISSRSSSTSFGIQTPVGSTAITFADGAITIYRAFNSLNAAEAGASGTSYLNTANLVTGGFQLHLACYGDGADATATSVDGYTTGPDNYIRIFTPVSATEVGATQRHVGTWAASNVYTLAYNGTAQALAIADEYVRVEGLQISVTTAAAGGPNGIYLNPGTTPNDIRVGYNIIKGVLSASATSAEGIQCNASGTYKIYNNLVYDFTDPSNDHTGIAFGAGATVTAYVYNNTVQGSYTGISRTTGTIIAKNNLTQTCTDGFNGTFDAASNYNLSDVASDAPGANSKNSTTVSFVNAGSDDFHLQSTDAGARRAGVDLTTDLNLSFTDDIDVKTRYGSWDIGADQYWDEPGLAVTMDAFFARGGDANDTISWRTESEKDNYGFYIYRRIKPSWWVAKIKELTANGYQLTAGTEGRKAKNGRMPISSEGSAANRSPSTVNSPDTLSANRSPSTVNLFKDRFDNDTTWKLVNIKPIPGAKGGRSVGPRNYRFIDYGVENGITYEYTIEDIDYSGVKIRHGIAEATPTKRLPKAFALHPNYPNPFNPITVIAYDLPKTCRVDISVYDLRGRKITTLVSASQMKEAGFYKIVWTGKDTYNRPVASGVYLYRIQAGEFVKLRKMTLLK